MEVGDRLLAVLAANVGRNICHRSRAIERHHRGQVVDARGTELLDVAPHSRGFQLEDSGCLARCQQLKRFLIVKWDAIKVDLDPAGGLDPVDRRAQDREVCEAEEVELQEAERLHPLHGDLRHLSVAIRRLLQRHDVGERISADHDAGRVGGGIAHDPFELFGKRDHRRILRTLRECLEVLVFTRTTKCRTECFGDRLRDSICFAVALAEHTANVA